MSGGDRDDDNVEERRLLDAVRATGRRSIDRAASPAGIAQLSCATSPHSTMVRDGHIAWPGQAPCSPVAPTTDQPVMPWRPGMPESQRAPPRRRIPGTQRRCRRAVPPVSGTRVVAGPEAAFLTRRSRARVPWVIRDGIPRRKEERECRGWRWCPALFSPPRVPPVMMLPSCEL